MINFSINFVCDRRPNNVTIFIRAFRYMPMIVRYKLKYVTKTIKYNIDRSHCDASVLITALRVLKAFKIIKHQNRHSSRVFSATVQTIHLVSYTKPYRPQVIAFLWTYNRFRRYRHAIIKPLHLSNNYSRLAEWIYNGVFYVYKCIISAEILWHDTLGHNMNC